MSIQLDLPCRAVVLGGQAREADIGTDIAALVAIGEVRLVHREVSDQGQDDRSRLCRADVSSGADVDPVVLPTGCQLLRPSAAVSSSTVSPSSSTRGRSSTAVQQGAEGYLHLRLADLQHVRRRRPGGVGDGKAGDRDRGLGTEFDVDRSIDLHAAIQCHLEGLARHPAMRLGAAKPPERGAAPDDEHEESQEAEEENTEHTHANYLPVRRSIS